MKFVQFFIDKGVDDLDYGLKQAVKGGYRDIVELLIEKEVADWNQGLERAADGGNRELVQLFIEKGATHWEHERRRSDISQLLNVRRNNHLFSVFFGSGTRYHPLSKCEYCIIIVFR